MSAASQMRRAAEKMRILGNGAHHGPWDIVPGSGDAPEVHIYSVETLTRYGKSADPVIGRIERGRQVDGMPDGYGVMTTPEFVASWSPEVADWAALALDQHADAHDTYDCPHEPCAHEEWAIRYLGEATS